jgi:hypothetical protein
LPYPRPPASSTRTREVVDGGEPIRIKRRTRAIGAFPNRGRRQSTAHGLTRLRRIDERVEFEIPPRVTRDDLAVACSISPPRRRSDLARTAAGGRHEAREPLSDFARGACPCPFRVFCQSPSFGGRMSDWGKWGRDGAPTTGWSFVAMEELPDRTLTCEMCERIRIRLIHELRHPDYPVTLRVGCCCAEKMEQDEVGPAARERKFRNLRQRRVRWLTRRWIPLLGCPGGTYVNTNDQFYVEIRPLDRARTRWGGMIEDKVTHEVHNARHEHGTAVEARLAAFDSLERLLGRREKFFEERRAQRRAHLRQINEREAERLRRLQDSRRARHDQTRSRPTQPAGRMRR